MTSLLNFQQLVRNPDREARASIPAAISPSPWHLLYANFTAFLPRFLALARQPKYFAPLVVDYCLLLQSIWSGKQFGPDFVYPVISITKRQSGRLARLILDHCRDMRQYERHAATLFPKGIDPPCVAVVDLDEVSQDVVEKGYGTQVDLYGLMSMLVLVEIMLTFTVHVFYLRSPSGWAAWFGWVYCPVISLAFCSYPVIHGDGTLTLAQGSDTSTPGYVVLLDQDFTVVLYGRQNVVEAIAEGGFNLSHPNFVWGLGLFEEEDSQYSSREILEALCEGAYLTIVASCWLLLFRPTTTPGGIVPMAVLFITILVLQGPPREHASTLHVAFSLCCRGFLPISILVAYGHTMIGSPLFEIFDLQRDIHFLSVILTTLFLVGYKAARNYPIRSAKFLDALGHPPIRKWQFDTLAAAATFQCLVLCRDIVRPVRSIDVSTLLDMLIPDQRDVWRAWKERVADRIVHETDISFAPTIPTFRDERQRQLKQLLDQAQLANDACRRFYDRHVPPYLNGC